jgi:hypothetical protein
MDADDFRVRLGVNQAGKAVPRIAIGRKGEERKKTNTLTVSVI